MAQIPDINLRDVDTSGDERLGEIVLLIAQGSADDPRFGAVKLNKLLFFSEVMAFLQRKKSLTGADFMRLDEGPVPRRLVPVRQSLLDQGRVTIDRVEMPAPLNPQERVVAVDNPKKELFEEEEIEIVEGQIRKFWEWNGKQLSNLTHKLPAWEIAGDKESIPIASILLKGFSPSEAAKSRALETAEKLGIE